MLHKKKPIKITIKQKHITSMNMLLNTAIPAIFWAIIYVCNPGAIYSHCGKSNFILTFLLEGCLEYQIYQVQYLQSNKAGFGGYKIIKLSTSYGRPIYREAIKYSFLKSYGKFKMCFNCATYTDLSFLITDEIPRVWYN